MFEQYKLFFFMVFIAATICGFLFANYISSKKDRWDDYFKRDS